MYSRVKWVIFQALAVYGNDLFHIKMWDLSLYKNWKTRKLEREGVGKREKSQEEQSALSSLCIVLQHDKDTYISLWESLGLGFQYPTRERFRKGQRERLRDQVKKSSPSRMPWGRPHRFPLRKGIISKWIIAEEQYEPMEDYNDTHWLVIYLPFHLILFNRSSKGTRTWKSRRDDKSETQYSSLKFIWVSLSQSAREIVQVAIKSYKIFKSRTGQDSFFNKTPRKHGRYLRRC